MKINWKVRFKNPQFIIQIVLAVGVPILAYFGLTAQDLTTWGSLFTIIFDALKNPYVLGMVGVSLYNSINDPTTKNFSDSSRALSYIKPGERKDQQ